ncbi:MAG: hypothetical protein FRX49_01535 [Trebouxia sp. A1-2]|nr:MAG: hypothetical protein FRX49_01535 [Trebouxia sp. A1-2]
MQHPRTNLNLDEVWMLQHLLGLPSSAELWHSLPLSREIKAAEPTRKGLQPLPGQDLPIGLGLELMLLKEQRHSFNAVHVGEKPAQQWQPAAGGGEQL